MQTRAGLVMALWCAGLGAAAQYAKFSVIYDLLPGLYPAAGWAIGFAVSLVGVIGICLGTVAGVVAAHLRYRRTVLWSLWIGAGVSAFQALMPPFEWLLVSRALEGASHLGLVVAAPTLIAQLSAPRHRGLTLTLWSTFFGVAYAVLAVAGAPLLAVGGVPGLFAAHSAYMAAMAVILSRVLRNLPQNPPVGRLRIGGVLRDHLTIYGSPNLAAPAVGWLFYTFCFVSILTVLPPHLPPESRQTLMALMPLASIASSLGLGVWLIRHLSAVAVVQAGFALSAVSVLWLLSTPVSPAACLVLAAALGLVQGASFAAVPQLNSGPDAQARANGAMAQTGNIGNTLGTPVMALALAGFGYPAMPVLAGLALLTGLIAHAILARMRAMR
ncbi:MAG: MFS transporter [Rhodobacteraceae bacterium]|nr:MFS transporter [Paracoccaceae bacterium]